MESIIKALLIKRLLFIPLGIIALVATAYAQHDPNWTEHVYSQTVYPALSTVVGFLPSLVSISLMEWVTVLFILFCLGYIVYYVRKIILYKRQRSVAAREGVPDQESNSLDSDKGQETASEAGQSAKGDTRVLILYRGVMGLVALLCVVYFTFTALCGLNYYRYTFTSYTGYTLEESSVEELKQLCTSLAADLSVEREALGVDTDLFAPAPGAFDYYAEHSVETMQILAEEYPVLKRQLYSAPKPVVLSELMSDAGIGGMFFPFTMESNINAQLPFFTTPSTMAHELAHQCGFMREDEANFIAHLACKESDEPLMRYSGQLMAFNYSVSALYRVDKEAASEILSNLPEAVQHDRAQSRQFWMEHEGVIHDISQDINDAYLRSNNQTDGVQSYGRMVDLLLAEQRATAG